MYAAQGFFSAAQGERKLVQKGGRNSQVQEHSSSISEPLLTSRKILDVILVLDVRSFRIWAPFSENERGFEKVK